ncbi:MAG: DUF3306 domain-containing protein [Piscinibacter sp.]|uniref:DUF3306 domain-containing protein n=1 Tax=Piscinibacter sp. TaxID=1903157 RepID=UPI001B755CAE|nr:DUF3306 domain-containing protein [Piscinibacter sp.]MBP5988607.1 DUF3306 domain-containing protein [Piscinibacter sp.]MBP6025904.1 DUF3306 domain-containing protein [Piscinibacter sp.]
MSEDYGFFARWSRRKVQQREQHEAPVPEAKPAAPVAPPAAAPAAAVDAVPQPPAAEAPPTLEEAGALTPASDFTRFVARDVAPEVKNAALKKLFADPQFNLMDGLDIYIDDYGKPDPLPEGMLRQLAQSQFLGLFDDDKKKSDATAPSLAPTLEAPPDEDADLRLQSHDAADAAEPGAGEPGAGEDAAGER